MSGEGLEMLRGNLNSRPPPPLSMLARGRLNPNHGSNQTFVAIGLKEPQGFGTSLVFLFAHLEFWLGASGKP